MVIRIIYHNKKRENRNSSEFTEETITHLNLINRHRAHFYLSVKPYITEMIYVQYICIDIQNTTPYKKKSDDNFSFAMKCHTANGAYAVAVNSSN